MTAIEAETSKTNLNELARELLHLKLDDVVPSQTNPRLSVDKEPFEELKKSILQNGLLQPIVVRPIADGYEIIGGHRRFAAVSDLSRDLPGDKRFKRIAAVVRDVDEEVVPVLQLAENLNRADLSPLEVADAIARAVAGGVTQERLAEQLGWTRRHVGRFIQIAEAPAWLRELAREVKVTKKKVDDAGKPVIDEKTQKPMLDVERYPGLPFTYVIELITLYNVLHENDCIQLEELGGDKFKPQAERVVRKLATAAAVDGWTTAKLRAEIKKAKNPQPAVRVTGVQEAKAPSVLAIRDDKLQVDMKRARALAQPERAELAAKLGQALRSLGFKDVVISV